MTDYYDRVLPKPNVAACPRCGVPWQPFCYDCWEPEVGCDWYPGDVPPAVDTLVVDHRHDDTEDAYSARLYYVPLENWLEYWRTGDKTCLTGRKSGEDIPENLEKI